MTLTKTEMTLAELESAERTIERGKQAYLEVSLALTSIRDGRGYRFQYGTFEQYVWERWGWSRQVGYNYIQAAETFANVKSTLQNGNLPNLTQAVQLATLAPEVQRDIASQVDFSNTTVRELREIVREKQERPLAVHFSSATDNWETPADLFRALNGEFGFELDVCASQRNAKCQRFFTVEQNGLAQSWEGTCWMNPPYGDAIAAWVKKAFDESQRGATVVCLVPARTDTAWWWDYCRFGEIRFLRGRLRFGGSDNGAPFPSAVVVFPSEPRVRWWEWRTA